MKKLILIALAIFSIQTYAQVQGCQFTGKVDSLVSIPTTLSCRSASEFAVITVTLLSANDTIQVFMGTSLKDSTAAQQEYGQISIIDMLNGDELTEITGNTSTNRKYFVKWGYKQKNMQLKGTTNSGDTPYIVEFY